MFGTLELAQALGHMLPMGSGDTVMMAGHGKVITIGAGHLFTMAVGCWIITMAGYGYRGTIGVRPG